MADRKVAIKSKFDLLEKDKRDDNEFLIKI